MADLLAGFLLALFWAFVTGAGFLMASFSLSMLLLELTDSLEALLALPAVFFFEAGGVFF